MLEGTAGGPVAAFIPDLLPPEPEPTEDTSCCFKALSVWQFVSTPTGNHESNLSQVPERLGLCLSFCRMDTVRRGLRAGSERAQPRPPERNATTSGRQPHY